MTRAAVGAGDAVPAVAQLAGWDAVGSTGAYTDSSYSIVVPTLADSNSAGIHRATYLVRAATATPAVYYDSPADSGYSKDDLPPAQPAPFAAAYIEGAVQLHWGANAEPDFWYYRIYRGESVEFVPDAGHLIATRSDTGYVDAGPPGRTYKLSAVDVNGNEGGYAVASTDEPLDVAGATPVALALEPPHPNPAVGGRLSVWFALPGGAPARLELLDVSGRRVAAREVGGLGAGRHAVELGAGRALAPGLYLIRLTQGPAVRVARVALLE